MRFWLTPILSLAGCAMAVNDITDFHHSVTPISAMLRRRGAVD